MTTHKIFLNSGKFLSHKVFYMDVMDEFFSIHMSL